MSNAYAIVVPDPLHTLETVASPANPERMPNAFRAGTGGLHSVEN
jgi:hypothetical protein